MPMMTGFPRAALFSALLLATAMPAQPQPLRAVDIEAEERAAVKLITQSIAAERARLAPGTRPLAEDPVLHEIAQQRVDEMARGAPFAHEDEQGRFVAANRVRQRFGPYGAVGENIMMERDPSRSFDPEAFARRAVAGWMASDGHRENILSRHYDRSGIAVAVEGSAAYATQIFWGPPLRRPQGGALRRP